MTDVSGGFVPVNRRALLGMGQIMDRAGRAAVAQRAATARLLELADDLRDDAVQRLRERGASEAQVERYEAAFLSGAAAVRQTGAELDARVRARDSGARGDVERDASGPHEAGERRRSVRDTRPTAATSRARRPTPATRWSIWCVSTRPPSTICAPT